MSAFTYSLILYWPWLTPLYSPEGTKEPALGPLQEQLEEKQAFIQKLTEQITKLQGEISSQEDFRRKAEDHERKFSENSMIIEQLMKERDNLFKI